MNGTGHGRGIWIVVSILTAAGHSAAIGQEPALPKAERNAWFGVHLIAPSPAEIPLLKRAIDEALLPLGVNTLVLEINFNFGFESHPELRGWSLWDKAQAAEFARFCRARGVRVIPQLNCLGHQSWSKSTHPLLTKYPEFDETPGFAPNNEGIYCRSWCPQHPGVNKVVFALIDELIDAFEADAFHVGMDEVFLIASEHCPRCRGEDPAALFARAVNDLHGHIVGKRGATMLMWADRLLDSQETGYGEWEASANGTAPAVDLIPKDIILCDWHYEPLADYPGKPDRYRSVGSLLDKGFRVWPASWHKREPALAFVEESQAVANERMLGYLATTWISPERFLRVLLGETAGDDAGPAPAVVESMKACLARARQPSLER